MIKKLLPIILLTFVNTIGFSLFFPILPYIVNDLGGGDILYAVILSIYSICVFFAAPFFGALSDVYGRRNILLISHLGTLLSWVLLAVSYFVTKDTYILGVSAALWVLTLSRMTDGITGGNVSAASAYVSDVTTKEERTKAYGLTGSAMGIGFIFGPIIGSFSYQTQYGYLGTAFVAFCISLITLFFIYFGLKETVDLTKTTKLTLSQNFKNIFSFATKIKKYSGNKIVTTMFKVKFLFSLTFVSYVSVIVLFLKNSLGLNEQASGLFFGALGVFLIVNQGFVVPKISKVFGERNVLVYSQILMALTFIGYFLFNLPLIILIFAYIGNVGISANMINIRSILSKNSSEKDQGEILGIDMSIMSICNAFVPLVAGVVFVAMGDSFFIVLAVLSSASFFILKMRKSLSF